LEPVTIHESDVLGAFVKHMNPQRIVIVRNVQTQKLSMELLNVMVDGFKAEMLPEKGLEQMR
jgi:hypothetical protein